MRAELDHELLGVEIGGRYRLVHCLSNSPTSGVFEAYQDDTQRLVILKILYGAVKEDSITTQRFNVRLGIARRVNHPNAVRILDCGWDPRGLYVVMKVLRGQTLSSRLKETALLHFRESAAIAGSIVRVLIDAHSRGLVHCHLNPHSIFLHQRDSGEVVVKVLNFGLSQFLYDSLVDGQNTTGAFRRPTRKSSHFVAPEQLAGTGYDYRADLYAVGVLSFRMLAGVVPFPTLDVAASEQESAGDTPSLPVATPPAYRDLILELMASEPAGRPQDTPQVLEVLSGLTGGYRLGRAVPDGAGAGRGVVPRIVQARGRRGDESYRSRPYGTEQAGRIKSVDERTKRIEESLLIPLEGPRRDPFGVASGLVMVVGFLVWWFFYGNW